MDKVERLIEALSDTDVCIRRHTAVELGEIKDTRAVEPLIKALYDEDKEVRRNAIAALGELGDVRAVSHMTETYLGNGPSHRIDIPVIDSRTQTEEDKRFIALALLKIGPPTLKILIDIVENNGGLDFHYPANFIFAWQVSLLALWMLHDTHTLVVINRLTKHHDSWVRRSFVWFLQEQPEELATVLLIELLEDESTEVRKEAALALGYKRSTRVRKALTRTLGDVDPEVKETAADSLKEWHSFYENVRYIHFGVISLEEEKYDTTLKDPDLSELTLPMTNLCSAYINTNSFDIILLNKFIDYALKYLGETFIMQHVQVYYYGSPKNLEPKLRNLLKDLFNKEWELQ